MRRPIYRFLDDSPSSMSETLLVLEEAIGERVRLFRPGACPRSWSGCGEHHFVYVAETPRGRQRIEFEARINLWAANHGIRTPRMVAAADDWSWLATERVREDLPVGTRYVDDALATARRIGDAAPPPALLPGRRSRQEPLTAISVRLLRLVMSPIHTVRFLELRRQAHRLPNDTLAHGDYQSGNVLFDRANGCVHVIDWEDLAMAPAGTDLLTMWCSLENPDDRDVVIEAVLTRTSAAERERLALLHERLALSWLANLVLAPRRYRDHEMDWLTRAGFAQQRVEEARANADAWNGRSMR